MGGARRQPVGWCGTRCFAPRVGSLLPVCCCCVLSYMPLHLLVCAQAVGPAARFPHNMLKGRMGVGKRSPGEAAEAGNDYSSKLLHLAWHPEANVIACAASNSLYMYCA